MQKDNIELLNMDCLEYLGNVPDKSVNLVLIDPPYEVSRDTNFQSGEKTGRDTDRFRVSMDFGEWDKGFCCLEAIIKECYRVLVPGGTIICFYDLWKITVLSEYLKNAKFKQLRFLEWIKTNPVPINSKTNYLTNAREIAISAVKDKKPIFNSEYDNGIYEEDGEIYKFPICHDKGRFHPTQKPESLISALIEKHSNAGDTVLDCFSGSGTTAVCSVRLGRKFKGCELDENYYKKSINRIGEDIHV